MPSTEWPACYELGVTPSLPRTRRILPAHAPGNSMRPLIKSGATGTLSPYGPGPRRGALRGENPGRAKPGRRQLDLFGDC
jgi:hypothetical protein